MGDSRGEEWSTSSEIPGADDNSGTRGKKDVERGSPVPGQVPKGLTVCIILDRAGVLCYRGGCRGRGFDKSIIPQTRPKVKQPGGYG